MFASWISGQPPSAVIRGLGSPLGSNSVQTGLTVNTSRLTALGPEDCPEWCRSARDVVTALTIISVAPWNTYCIDLERPHRRASAFVEAEQTPGRAALRSSADERLYGHSTRLLNCKRRFSACRV